MGGCPTLVVTLVYDIGVWQHTLHASGFFSHASQGVYRMHLTTTKHEFSRRSDAGCVRMLDAGRSYVHMIDAVSLWDFFVCV